MTGDRSSPPHAQRKGPRKPERFWLIPTLTLSLLLSLFFFSFPPFFFGFPHLFFYSLSYSLFISSYSRIHCSPLPIHLASGTPPYFTFIELRATRVLEGCQFHWKLPLNSYHGLIQGMCPAFPPDTGVFFFFFGLY